MTVLISRVVRMDDFDQLRTWPCQRVECQPCAIFRRYHSAPGVEDGTAWEEHGAGDVEPKVHRDLFFNDECVIDVGPMRFPVKEVFLEDLHFFISSDDPDRGSAGGWAQAVAHEFSKPRPVAKLRRDLMKLSVPLALSLRKLTEADNDNLRVYPAMYVSGDVDMYATSIVAAALINAFTGLPTKTNNLRSLAEPGTGILFFLPGMAEIVDLLEELSLFEDSDFADTATVLPRGSGSAPIRYGPSENFKEPPQWVSLRYPSTLPQLPRRQDFQKISKMWARDHLFSNDNHHNHHHNQTSYHSWPFSTHF